MAGWLKAWSLCKELEPASPEDKLRPVINPIKDDEDRIIVIDSDPGKSVSSTASREEFKKVSPLIGM